MKFVVTVTMGNEGMRSIEDLACCLEDMAAKLRERRMFLELESETGDYPSGAVRDVNGNKVGDWEVTE